MSQRQEQLLPLVLKHIFVTSLNNLIYLMRGKTKGGLTFRKNFSPPKIRERITIMAFDENFETTYWDAKEVQKASSGAPSSHRAPQNAPVRKRRKKKNPVLRFFVWLICVVLSSAILAAVGWLLMNDLCALNKEPASATIVITKEDSVASVADKLYDEGLIEYKWFFKLFALVAKADEKIGEGTYDLDTEMDYRCLIASMKGHSSLNTETVTVMIPEGYSVSQIIDLLVEKGVSSEESLTDAATEYAFEFEFVDNENTGEISRLEGYLFPDTYEFYVGEKGSVALKRLLTNTNSKLDPERLAQIEESGYTLEEIMIIASLIEKETDGGDHDKIASVIYNRLENPGAETVGMLQIDASLIYGLGESYTGELTAADLETDTPYNLSKYKGLPPTPICNPGLESILAAIEPAETDYYFYALGTDGAHHFFTNYNDHVNFVNSSEYGG